MSQPPPDHGQPGPQGPPPQGRPGDPQQPYPQQPHPHQGYPHQGYPQQTYPHQGYPQGAPYPQGPSNPTAPTGDGQPPKKKRTGLFVLTAAGALALILAVVAVAVNAGGKTDVADEPGRTGTSSNAPAAPLASEAVNGYLTALSRGDAESAIAYAADPSSIDTALMTPAVMAASAKIAPLTTIAVTEQPDPDATSVTATYSLGSTPVTASYEVVKVADDWKLVTVAAPVDVSLIQADGVPMVVNGAKVKTDSLTLLPGAYRFTTGSTYLSWGSHPDVLVQEPSDDPDTTQLNAGVSSKGRSATLSAVKDSWSRCLKSKKANPSSCPLTSKDSKYKLKDGTVTWSRNGADPFKKVKDTVGQTFVQYQIPLNVDAEGSCTVGGRAGTCGGTLTGTAVATAEVSGQQIKVGWQ